MGKLRDAARRLLPAEGYLTPEMPDDERVNLVTSVGAIRQLIRALEEENAQG